ncbi:isochorismatase family protein [Streptosporangium sp. NPDC002607]
MIRDHDEVYGRSLPFGERPALILIDLMRAYFEPGAELYMGSRDCLDSAARVLAAARSAGAPVIHTRVAFGPDGVDGGLFFRKVAPLRHLVDGGGPLGELMPEVAPGPGETVIVKQYASAFFGTVLASTLNALRVDTLVIAGVSTSGCVRATAVDGIQHGFVPVVVRQAVGDRDPRPHEANLFDIQAKYGEVWDEAAVLERFGLPPAVKGPLTV